MKKKQDDLNKCISDYETQETAFTARKERFEADYNERMTRLIERERLTQHLDELRAKIDQREGMYTFFIYVYAYITF